jgi:hypothetical protein
MNGLFCKPISHVFKRFLLNSSPYVLSAKRLLRQKKRLHNNDTVSDVLINELLLETMKNEDDFDIELHDITKVYFYKPIIFPL